MPQLLKPTTVVKVTPKDGEIEITLNINITVDGKVQAVANNAEVVSVDQIEDEKVNDLFDSKSYIPNFGSGMKVNFGKKEK